MKTHSAEMSKKCNHCDYKSSRADVLRTHLKTHSGEKPYKCNQCDYVCSDPSALRRHLIMHPLMQAFENAHWEKVIQMQPM